MSERPTPSARKFSKIGGSYRPSLPDNDLHQEGWIDDEGEANIEWVEVKKISTGRNAGKFLIEPIWPEEIEE